MPERAASRNGGHDPYTQQAFGHIELRLVPPPRYPCVPPQTHRQGGGRRVPSAVPRFGFPAYRHDEDLDQDQDQDPDAESAARAAAAAAGLVRWGAFSCALVPLTLLACGGSLPAAGAAAAGLAVVTAACVVLLRLSEYAHVQQSPGRFPAGRPGPHRGRHSRTGTGLHRGGRYWGTPGQQ